MYELSRIFDYALSLFLGGAINGAFYATIIASIWWICVLLKHNQRLRWRSLFKSAFPWCYGFGCLAVVLGWLLR